MQTETVLEAAAKPHSSVTHGSHGQGLQVSVIGLEVKQVGDVMHWPERLQGATWEIISVKTLTVILQNLISHSDGLHTLMCFPPSAIQQSYLF